MKGKGICQTVVDVREGEEGEREGGVNMPKVRDVELREGMIGTEHVYGGPACR